MLGKGSVEQIRLECDFSDDSGVDEDAAPLPIAKQVEPPSLNAFLGRESGPPSRRRTLASGRPPEPRSQPGSQGTVQKPVHPFFSARAKSGGPVSAGASPQAAPRREEAGASGPAAPCGPVPAFFLPPSRRRELQKEEAAKRLKEEAERRKQDARTFFRAGQRPAVTPAPAATFFLPREASRGQEAARSASGGAARRTIRVQSWPLQQHVAAPAALGSTDFVAPWPRLAPAPELGPPRPGGGSPQLSAARDVAPASPRVVDLTGGGNDTPHGAIDLCSPGPSGALAEDESVVLSEMCAAADTCAVAPSGDDTETEVGAAWRSLLHAHLHRAQGGAAGPETAVAAAWPALHCPRSASDAVGQPRAAALLTAWLRAWCECREGPDAAPAPPSKKRRSRGDDEEEYTLSDEEGGDGSGQWGECGDVSDEDDDCGEPGVLSPAFVLVGPPGVGKTSLVYACAADVGAQVLEVNASARRTRESVRRQFGEATQSRRVGGGVGATAADASSLLGRAPASLGAGRGRGAKRGRVRSSDSPPPTPVGTGAGPGVTVLLFDEADIDFREDTGWSGAVRALLTEARTPIVLTCNELPPYLRTAGVPVCSMPRPAPTESAPSLVAVAAAHGARLTGAHALALARHCRGDMRRALWTLQLWMGQMGRAEAGAGEAGPSIAAAPRLSPQWRSTEGNTRLALATESPSAEVAEVEEGEDALPLGPHHRVVCVALEGPPPAGALRAAVGGVLCAVDRSATPSLLHLHPPALDAVPREVVRAWTRRPLGLDERAEAEGAPAVDASPAGRVDSDSDFQSPFRLRPRAGGGGGGGGAGAEACSGPGTSSDAGPGADEDDALQGDPAIGDEEEEEGGDGPLVRCLRKKSVGSSRRAAAGPNAPRPAAFIAEDEPAVRVVLPFTVEWDSGAAGASRRWRGYLVYMAGGDAGSAAAQDQPHGRGGGPSSASGAGAADDSRVSEPLPALDRSAPGDVAPCATLDAVAGEAEFLSACAALWQRGAAPASPGREVESYCTLVGSEAELPAASVVALARTACGGGAASRGGGGSTSRPGSAMSGSGSRSGFTSSRPRSGFAEAAPRGAGAASPEVEGLIGSGRDRFAAALAGAAPLWASGTVEPDFGGGSDVQEAIARAELRGIADDLCTRAAGQAGAAAEEAAVWAQGATVEGDATPLEEVQRAASALRRTRCDARGAEFGVRRPGGRQDLRLTTPPLPPTLSRRGWHTKCAAAMDCVPFAQVIARGKNAHAAQRRRRSSRSRCAAAPPQSSPVPRANARRLQRFNGVAYLREVLGLRSDRVAHALLAD